MHRSGLRRVGALVAVMGVLLVTLFTAPTLAAGPVVHIRGTTLTTYHFFPRKVSVVAPTTVHWRWTSNAPHNVTFTKLGEASASGTTGDYKLRFKKPGTYRYLCTIHGFTGVVTVN